MQHGCWYQRRPEGIRFHGAGVTGGSELPMRVLGMNLGPLHEQ